MQDKLSRYIELLEYWNSKFNLVQKQSMKNIWERHIQDCLQISEYISTSDLIIDLGSGAGFPGIILSIMGYPHVILTEINHKKASFLNEVKRQLGLDCLIYCGDVKKLNVPRGTFAKITATARGFSSLQNIFDVLSNLDIKNAILNKGEKYNEELEEARNVYDFNIEVFPSKTSETGVILKIDDLRIKQ